MGVWKLKSPRDINQLHPQIERELTHEQFGYFPEEISALSSGKVIWRCANPTCSSPLNASRERQLKSNPAFCRTCWNRIKGWSCTEEVMRNPEFLHQLLADEKLVLETRSLRNTCRSLLERTLQQINGSTKEARTQQTLGYTSEELKAHLMTHPNWSRMGLTDWVPPSKEGWHIDHIFPVAAFVQAGVDDVTIINCLENLQPLHHKDNQQKSSKFNSEDFLVFLEKKHVQKQHAIKTIEETLRRPAVKVEQNHITSDVHILKYEYQGKEYTIRELAEMSGVAYSTIDRRLREGKSVEEALCPERIKIKEKREEVAVGRAGMTREKATEIRQAYKDGVRGKAAYERFGITKSAYIDITGNRVWKEESIWWK